MRATRKAAIFWSGGKDSVLALHHVRESRPDLVLVRLVTCVSKAYGRVSMHGVQRRLIEDQADALRLPVEFVVIPSYAAAACPVELSGPGADFPPNDTYSPAVLAAFARLKAAGIESIVFGDIFLEDLRAYREGLLARAGLEGVYPLWGRDTEHLYGEFCQLGYGAVTVCVDLERLREGHCGQVLSPAFRDSLPEQADPCGERGEYHSFVFDGPAFTRSVPFAMGEAHRQPPFLFQELCPCPVEF